MSGMKPYFDRDGITIFCGDCRDVLPTLPKVDLVLTDPPYNIGSPQRISDMRTGGRLIGGDFGTFDNGAITPDEWFPLVPKTVVVSFYGSRQMHRLIQAAENAAYEVIQDFHWCKSNPPVPMRSVGFSWGVESGYVFRPAGTKHKHNNDAGICPNYKISPLCAGAERTDHATQKPLKVMKWLVNHWSFPEQTILDPFMGSGTTLVAAKLLGRRAIGIEINEDYCRIAVERLRQGVLQFTEAQL